MGMEMEQRILEKIEYLALMKRMINHSIRIPWDFSILKKKQLKESFNSF